MHIFCFLKRTYQTLQINKNPTLIWEFLSSALYIYLFHIAVLQIFQIFIANRVILTRSVRLPNGHNNWNAWLVHYATILHSTAILGREQPGLMRLTLLWIMQLLVRPVAYQWATDAPLAMITEHVHTSFA